jgi:hypothetical protein
MLARIENEDARLQNGNGHVAGSDSGHVTLQGNELAAQVCHVAVWF